MNKKIIAIAIATAMAAPVAMADIKVSGQMGGALVDTETKVSDASGSISLNYRPIQEAGYSKLQFDMTSGGTGYARGGLSLKKGFQGGEPTLREAYFGVKGGWGSFQLGRMASALKNLEKDPYISTFLQMRGSAAVPGDATEQGSGFVNGLIQYSGKVGAVDLTVQMNPMENVQAPDAANDDAPVLNGVGPELAKGSFEGMTAIAVSGKAGGVNLYAATASWDTYACSPVTVIADELSACSAANTAVKNSYNKLGASMKFGAIKVSAQMGSQEWGTSDGDSLHIMANMGLGNGLSVNAVIGQSEIKNAGNPVKEEEDFMRVAVTKNISKNTNVFAGYSTSEWKQGTDKEETTQLGLGLQVKF